MVYNAANSQRSNTYQYPTEKKCGNFLKYLHIIKGCKKLRNGKFRNFHSAQVIVKFVKSIKIT